VQYVINSANNYRGLAGRLVSGSYTKGQPVTVLPANTKTLIEKIEVNNQEVDSVGTNTGAVIHLKDDENVVRGNTIVPAGNLPKTQHELRATICWMDSSAYVPGQAILLQQNSFCTKAVIREVVSKVDIHSLEQQKSDGTMHLNDICKVRIETREPISFDSYAENRHTGAFILINETSNNTIAAGTID
jgi:sulfate adenylyltransferase subunit 1